MAIERSPGRLPRHPGARTAETQEPCAPNKPQGLKSGRLFYSQQFHRLGFGFQGEAEKREHFVHYGAVVRREIRIEIIK